jgi:transposase-like protein
MNNLTTSSIKQTRKTTPYSDDLRIKAVQKVKEGLTVVEVAKFFEISANSIFRWLKLQRVNGSISPVTNYHKGGYKHSIIDLVAFRKFVDMHSDKTALEMSILWGNISLSTFCRYLKKICYTRKKRVFYTENGMKKNVIYIWMKSETCQ